MNIVAHSIFNYNFTINNNKKTNAFEPQKTEKEVILIRLTPDLLSLVDQKANEIGISRNELINQCIEYAISNIGENI